MMNCRPKEEEKVAEFFSAIPSNNNESSGGGDGTIVLTLPREPTVVQGGKELPKEPIRAMSGPLLNLEQSTVSTPPQPLSREELLRRRDLKIQAKNEQKVLAMEQDGPKIEHKARRGERYWTDEEHERFLEAIRRYGKNWYQITRFVATRSRQSVYSHAQKFRKRVQKEPQLEGADCAHILSDHEPQYMAAQYRPAIAAGAVAAACRKTISIEQIQPW